MIKQKNSENICLIGYGYWGKILHKNLLNLGYENVKVVDQVLDNLEEINNTFDAYFVSTPYSTHYKILKKIGKYRGKKIWTEKPLVDSKEKALEIYSLMEKNNNSLFVDWIYTFNPLVHKIEEELKNKKVKFILLNRTNDGPVRDDCSSIEDLSVHDLSILYRIFPEEKIINFNWNEFSIKTHEKNGSSISSSYFDGTQIIINSSWQHKYKNRVSIFVTEEGETIIFDDIKKIVSSKEWVFTDDRSPLEMSLEYFFSNSEYFDNKDITLRITETIERWKERI